MEAPPFSGNPYDFINTGTPNPGQQGVVLAWEGMRYFWGTAAQEGWNDLESIMGGSVIVI